MDYLSFSSDALVLSVQSSVQWIAVLRSVSGKSLLFSVQGFVLWNNALLVVVLLCCLYKAVCGRLLHFCRFCRRFVFSARGLCFGDVLLLSTQGVA